jgi:probable selenium-dependent hydroxylase accessory protein YqeC
MLMSLDSLIDIKNSMDKKEIITVVGAGGKTSFIDSIAQIYRKKFRVLLTTTTKIFVPCEASYENMILLDDISEEELSNLNFVKGITVCGKCINEDNKIVGIDFKDLKKLEDKFDLILIEGDGSKKKKLKGWNDNEPIVYENTTKTIGILDITSYNMKINEENIHRLDKFIDQIGYKNNLYKKLNKGVDVSDLVKIVLNKKALFKNSKGERVLFINKVENNGREAIAREIMKSIIEKDENIKLYFGSIKQNTCTLYK